MFVLFSSRRQRAARWSPRRLYAASLFSLLLMAHAASAADPNALSLERSMQLAAADAPLLEAESARVTAAREDARRAGALPDPKLVFGIDNLVIDGPQALHLGADEMTMRRIGLMQDWPSRRKREARTAQAEARVEEAVVTGVATRLAVERAAAQAWIERWTAERERVVLVELRQEAELAVRIAKARLRGGATGPGDALAAQGALLELDNRLTAAGARVEAAQAGLARWLGDAAQAPLAEAPDFAAPRVPVARLRASLGQQALLRLWDRREHTAERAVTVAQAERRPDWSFGASYGARSAGLPDMVMLEVGIGLPLFPRGRQDRDIAARRAELDAVRAERDDARRSQREALDREIALWQGLAAEAARYRSSLLPLARDRAAVALAAYRGGADLQPWLNARRDELDARLRHVQTLGELAQRWATLATLLPEENAR